MTKRGRRVIAIASAGGHWVQLLRLRPAFQGVDVVYISTHAGLRRQVIESKFYSVRDANRWDKFGLMLMTAQIFWLLVRIRPDAIVTTGAAPGYVAIRLGKLLGAKGLWLDSIANSEELSHSGKMAGRVADEWLTQWPELSSPEGPDYHGAVL